MKESDVSTEVKQILDHSGARMFRNNVGCMKIGRRFVRYGVGGPGGSDFIGFLPVKIKPSMVGKTLAVFVAIETKRSEGGTATQEQKDFIANVHAGGGVGGFARCWQDALGIIKNWLQSFD